VVKSNRYNKILAVKKSRRVPAQNVPAGNHRLRGGIIGCGFFGQIQLEAWQRIPEAEIATACDIDLQRAQNTAPRAYSSAEQMLQRERLDFVDIATRPEAHLPLVRLAAMHHIPVICQKPMAPSWGEVIEMVETAEAYNVPLMIHENWRWQPWYRVTKQLIERGEIGQPIAYWFRTVKRDGAGAAPYPNQPYFRQMPRLLIYETLVHHIDTARFLFGDIKSMFAHARRINSAIAGEDRALLIVSHQRTLEGTIDGHRYLDPEPDGPAMGEAGFEGEQGRIYIAATGDVYRNGRKIWMNDVTWGYRGDSVGATQRHFIACLKSGEPFETNARDYLKTFGAVEAAYRSVSEGRAIAVSEIL
jgi:predicted dehydrogenase